MTDEKISQTLEVTEAPIGSDTLTSGSDTLASNSGTLASRWDRIWASLIDGIISICVVLPIMYFTGGFNGLSKGIQPSMGYNLLLGVIGIIVFSLIHGKFLVNNGQTIGKKAIGIKIVDLNGNLPTLKDHLIKRYAVFFITGQIPVVGPIFSLINILFIFGKEKRCGHDFIAGTKVVNC